MRILKKVATIILNYNTSEDCQKCISYIKQQQEIEATIIVIDNCSSKEEFEKLSKLCADSDITIIRSNENRGYSAGNNIGLRYAAERGFEYVMILNPDVELFQHDYLEKMVAKMESDNKIAVLGTDIESVKGNHQNPLREIGFWEELCWFYELLPNIRSKGMLYATGYNISGYCEKLSGCCFLIRMSFAQQIFFLDECVFLYCEEPILAKQVQKSGMKLYYMSNLQAFHNHKKSEKGNPVNRMRLFAESRHYYLKTYSGYSPFSVSLLRFSRLSQLFLYRMFKKRI